MTQTNRRYDLSLNPARGRRRRGFAGVFGLWIVLFNILAATLFGAVAKAETSVAGGSDGEEIVVCTGLGMVTLDRDGKPTDPGAPRAICPFCLPIMQGQLDVPVAVAAPAAPVAVAVVAKSPWERVPPAPARAVRAAPARAPPFA
ncbi:hypothetical protein M2323_001612 [Rhodoblastus acidophilus]|uniref:DUF2946 family protein n=1 Tax=Rhodoblastus acidophilus TaxID=1074 RepID=UPI0022259552|nr:DUF2946 family protein [Rhodoblastus acidophilus]MCW2283999.1 hypothetical protein [Rhodoblastus acidophilus]MCW2332695.1 hypothetical protein [Rhodoblastus acidophilus]